MSEVKFKCPMCTDCPHNCPLDNDDIDTRIGSSEWKMGYQQDRVDAIEEFADWLVEQGILGNRVISDGEITDYGKVYAKQFKQQLKDKKND